MLRPFVVPKKSSTTHMPYMFMSLMICLHKLSYRNSLKQTKRNRLHFVCDSSNRCDRLTLTLNYFPLNSHCTPPYSRSIVCIPRPFSVGQSLNLWWWSLHWRLPLCHSVDGAPSFGSLFASYRLCRQRRLSTIGSRNLQRNKCIFRVYLLVLFVLSW